MTIYVFSKELQDYDGDMYYGTGERDAFTSKEELIKDAEMVLERPLGKKWKNRIISKEIPDFDFYAIQGYVDGFGNDTYTLATFKTREECMNFITRKGLDNDEYTIVGQCWGTYKSYFDGD